MRFIAAFVASFAICSAAFAGDTPPLNLHGAVDTMAGLELLEKFEEAAQKSDAIYKDGGKTEFLIIEDNRIARLLNERDPDYARGWTDGVKSMPLPHEMEGNWDIVCGVRVSPLFSLFLTSVGTKKDPIAEDWAALMAFTHKQPVPSITIDVSYHDAAWIETVLDAVAAQTGGPGFSFLYREHSSETDILRDLKNGDADYGVLTSGTFFSFTKFNRLLYLGPNGGSNPYTPGLKDKSLSFVEAVDTPGRFAALAIAYDAAPEMRAIAEQGCASFRREYASKQEIEAEIVTLAKYTLLAKGVK